MIGWRPLSWSGYFARSDRNAACASASLRCDVTCTEYPLPDGAEAASATAGSALATAIGGLAAGCTATRARAGCGAAAGWPPGTIESGALEPVVTLAVVLGFDAVEAERVEGRAGVGVGESGAAAAPEPPD
jgi:hypothetical protein